MIDLEKLLAPDEKILLAETKKLVKDKTHTTRQHMLGIVLRDTYAKLIKAYPDNIEISIFQSAPFSYAKDKPLAKHIMDYANNITNKYTRLK